MINIAMKTKAPLNRSSITSINNITNIHAENNRQEAPGTVNNHQEINQNISRQIPKLLKPVQKGQKISIESAAPLDCVSACFGWNTKNPQCDADVSAFLLGADGKVLGDSWFVFYGQTLSPDNSTQFLQGNSTDCEIIKINLKKLNSNIKKIVFVLTINEAFEKKLNFGMLKDAYIRILNDKNNAELASFKMEDYYSNVISMMIGEIYIHNGIWKFNAVGNGVARDLAGLCELYGVQVSN